MQENCRVLLNETSYESDSLSFYKSSMRRQTQARKSTRMYALMDTLNFRRRPFKNKDHKSEKSQFVIVGQKSRPV